MASPEKFVDLPVPRRPLRALYCTWEAVHDGTPLDAFLRYRLRVYEAKYRKSFHPLPFDIAIVGGAIVCVPNPEYKGYWEELQDEGGEGGVQLYLSPIEQEETARVSGQIEADAQDVEARSRSLRERIDEHETREAEARSTGTEPGPRTLQYVRPRCPKRPPIPWLLNLQYLSIVFLGLDEVFQLAWPILDRLGINTSRLEMEWQTAPLTIIGGVATAFMATTILLIAWNALVSYAAALSAGWEKSGPLRSGAKLAGLVVVSVLLLLFTLCIANLRHDTALYASGVQGAALGQSASNTDTSLFFFLTLLMPAGAAYIHFQAGKSPYWQARADFRKQLALYDQAENQLQLPLAKRDDVLDALRTTLAKCEQEKAGLEARRQALKERLNAYRNQYLKRLKDERSAVETYARTLVSQLGTECYFYHRAANRSHATHLIPGEPVCLSPQSPGDTPTEGDGAPSRNGKAPHYQIVRPLLPAPRQGKEI
jgi:hypothetical protein